MKTKKITLISLAFALLLSVAFSFVSPNAKAEYYPNVSYSGKYQYNVYNPRGYIKINALEDFKAYSVTTSFIFYKKQKNGTYKKVATTYYKKSYKHKVSTSVKTGSGTFKVSLITKYKKSKYGKTYTTATSLPMSDFKKIR